jgi:hypothetical protein
MVVQCCCKVATFAMARYAAKVVQRCCKIVVQLRVQIDNLLIVKANQRTLRADIALLFSEEPHAWLPEQNAKQVDQGHGRLTIRSLRASAELNDYLAPKWPDVAQVFQLCRTVIR